MSHCDYIPAKANVEFYSVGMGSFDPSASWTNEKDVDITRVNRIKMMPFGTGRRIWPLALTTSF